MKLFRAITVVLMICLGVSILFQNGANVNPGSERQILLAAVRARSAKPMSPALGLALKAVVWIAIAASTAVAVVKFGQPSANHLAVIGVAFLVGMATGVFAFVAQAKKTWPVITAYIDYQRIEARLKELET